MVHMRAHVCALFGMPYACGLRQSFGVKRGKVLLDRILKNAYIFQQVPYSTVSTLR